MTISKFERRAMTGLPFAVFRIRAGSGWTTSLTLTACGIGIKRLMAGALNRGLPPGRLQEAARLPRSLK